MEYEILAPAGDLTCAEVAINSGANAVYLGLNAFSARASAENFDDDSLIALLKKAKLLNVKVYVAMNTLVKDGEIEDFIRALLKVWSLGVDAIILQDIFLGKAIKEKYPEIILHLSTQAGVCNEYGAKLAKEYGFSRVILARETPISEIEKITKIIETETFAQGALCSCFSGQCYFSSFAGGNSGNRGRCKQPCRKLYSYDRTGYGEKAYALSLSDLCVGEKIEKLKNAGVVSFKIEGRMRRAEYVAAAVKYYRLLLDGATETQKEKALSDLKRTFNRGNYTQGLAFLQDKRFLSRAVQGHLGEKVGVVKVENGQYVIESAIKCGEGDAFKVFRKGREIGGAIYLKANKRGFIISSKNRLLSGDNVFITTSKATNDELLKGSKRKEIFLNLRFAVGEQAVVSCDELVFESDFTLQQAQSRPLSKKDVADCFMKTDSLPLEVNFENVEIVGDIFLAKSQLNAFRREFYSALINGNEKRERLEYETFKVENFEKGKQQKTTVIASNFGFYDAEKIDIAVYKPNDYNEELNESFLQGNFEKYLYFPCLLTTKDLERIEYLIKEYCLDGVYAENYAGVQFAKERNLNVFAGTGFNLTNKIAIDELTKTPFVKYYAVSKELDEREQMDLMKENGFVLTSGNLKLMDLCYCPFEKSCKSCDKKSIYSLTDENNRTFPVKRYVLATGECRFETYNCVNLIGGKNVNNKILDCTLFSLDETTKAIQVKDNEEKQKELYLNYTAGHTKKSVL
ncbi:MAG: U32 family peptidase [Clostridiales bacterium]|nr:U32 family peptidase [Clostridiales bacterium]